MVRRLMGTVVVAALIMAQAAAAQEGALSKLYGRGVHSYFDGDYAGAVRSFSKAIESGSEDPRCYYFRGLAHMRSGRPAAARADFEQGSALESRATGRYYDISRALERVQGRARLTVERFRTEGRVDAVAESRRVRQLRYDRIRENEAEVLRRPLPDTLDGSSSSTGVEAAPPVETDDAPATDVPPPADVIVPADSGDNPFGDPNLQDDLPAPPGVLDAPPPISPDAIDDGAVSETAAAIESIDTRGVSVPADTLGGVLGRALLKVLSDGQDAAAPTGDAPRESAPEAGDDPFDAGLDPNDDASGGVTPDDSPAADNPFGGETLDGEESGGLPDIDLPLDEPAPPAPDAAEDEIDPDNPLGSGGEGAAGEEPIDSDNPFDTESADDTES